MTKRKGAKPVCAIPVMTQYRIAELARQGMGEGEIRAALGLSPDLMRHAEAIAATEAGRREGVEMVSAALFKAARGGSAAAGRLYLARSGALEPVAERPAARLGEAVAAGSEAEMLAGVDALFERQRALLDDDE